MTELKSLPRKAIEILPDLQSRFGRILRPDIVSVRLLKKNNRVYLEMTTVDKDVLNLRDEKVIRSDLGFVIDGDGENDLLFGPDDSLETIYTNFMTLNAEDLAICTDLIDPAAYDNDPRGDKL